MAQERDEKRGSTPEPVVISRVFAAPRALVFKAWSSADHMKRWFSPEHFTVPRAIVDFRTGGTCDICMRAPDGTEFWSKGRYIDVTPIDRIVFESSWMGETDTPQFTALTTVTFEDAEGGTRLTVHQAYEIFDERALPAIAGAQEGWRQTLNRLEQEVARITAAEG